MKTYFQFQNFISVFRVRNLQGLWFKALELSLGEIRVHYQSTITGCLSICFNHFTYIIVVTQRASHVQQDMLTFPEDMILLLGCGSSCCTVFSFLYCGFFFWFAMALSVRFRMTISLMSTGSFLSGYS